MNPNPNQPTPIAPVPWRRGRPAIVVPRTLALLLVLTVARRRAGVALFGLASPHQALPDDDRAELFFNVDSVLASGCWSHWWACLFRARSSTC